MGMERASPTVLGASQGAISHQDLRSPSTAIEHKKHPLLPAPSPAPSLSFSYLLLAALLFWQGPRLLPPASSTSAARPALRASLGLHPSLMLC